MKKATAKKSKKTPAQKPARRARVGASSVGGPFLRRPDAHRARDAVGGSRPHSRMRLHRARSHPGPVFPFYRAHRAPCRGVSVLQTGAGNARGVRDRRWGPRSARRHRARRRLRRSDHAHRPVCLPLSCAQPRAKQSRSQNRARDLGRLGCGGRALVARSRVLGRPRGGPGFRVERHAGDRRVLKRGGVGKVGPRDPYVRVERVFARQTVRLGGDAHPQDGCRQLVLTGGAREPSGPDAREVRRYRHLRRHPIRARPARRLPQLGR